MKLKRWLWQKAQASMNLETLVFIDESGAKTNMTRLYGRAKSGQRVVDNVPAGHWCTTTMISSIRLDGSTACMVVDGATNKEVFRHMFNISFCQLLSQVTLWFLITFQRIRIKRPEI